MAHVIIRPKSDSAATQIVINGVDFSMDVYAGHVDLVQVGEEVGVQVTFALGRLDLGGDSDVQVTDRLRAVAQKVRSTVGGVA